MRFDMAEKQIERTLGKLSDMEELLRGKINANMLDKYGTPLLSSILESALAKCRECDAGHCGTCDRLLTRPVIDLFVKHGFDIGRSGIRCITPIVYAYAGKAPKFFTIRHLLMCGAGGTQQEYEDALESIGGEESENRVEHFYWSSNAFYAMYEMVDRYRRGMPYMDIFPFEQALGLQVDRVVLLGAHAKLHPTGRGVEYCGDIGFVSGDQCLVVVEATDALMMNGRAKEAGAQELTRIDKFVRGARITDYWFSHRTVKRKKQFYGEERMMWYGQRIMKICFDNGWVVRITNNFGEVEDDQVRPRFCLEHLGKRYRNMQRMMQYETDEEDEE